MINVKPNDFYGICELAVRMVTDRNVSGKVEIISNGKVVPNLTGFIADFDGKKFEFIATRNETDMAGYNTGKIEEINLSNFLSYKVANFEVIKQYQKAIEFDMLNIYMTSYLNAKNFIKEDLGVDIDGK